MKKVLIRKTKLQRWAANNKGLNAMGEKVLNSAIVLLFGICAKLNICASNPPLRQAANRYFKEL